MRNAYLNEGFWAQSILNIFRRVVVDLHESQNLDGPFANSSLAIGLFEKAGIKETPPSSIARFFVSIMVFDLEHLSSL
jgi:hypothetical protein